MSSIDIFGGLPVLAGRPTPVTLDEFPGYPGYLVQRPIFPANTQGRPIPQSGECASESDVDELIIPGGEITLGLEGVPIYFTWDGQRYQPNALLRVTERAKIFVGPTDPSTISGVVLSASDTWSVTS